MTQTQQMILTMTTLMMIWIYNMFVTYEMLIQERNDRRWVALEPSPRGILL